VLCRSSLLLGARLSGQQKGRAEVVVPSEVWGRQLRGSGTELDHSIRAEAGGCTTKEGERSSKKSNAGERALVHLPSTQNEAARQTSCEERRLSPVVRKRTEEGQPEEGLESCISKGRGW